MFLPISHLAGAGLGVTVQDIATAIYQQEGPVQNNNPGNLLYAGQPGATGKDYRGFAIFSTLQAGQQAEVNQLQLNITRGTCANGAPVVTLADELNCLTPPSENNTAAYIAAVSAQTGIDPNAPLSQVLAYPQVSLPADLQTQPQDFSGQTVTAGAGSLDLTNPDTLALLVGAGLTFWLALR